MFLDIRLLHGIMNAGPFRFVYRALLTNPTLLCIPPLWQNTSLVLGKVEKRVKVEYGIPRLAIQAVTFTPIHTVVFDAQSVCVDQPVHRFLLCRDGIEIGVGSKRLNRALKLV